MKVSRITTRVCAFVSFWPAALALGCSSDLGETGLEGTGLEGAQPEEVGSAAGGLTAEQDRTTAPPAPEGLSASASLIGQPQLWVGNYGYDAGGWRVAQHPRFLADVNGDGRRDIVGCGNAGSYVSLSTGSSFAAPTLWVANYGYDAGGWRVDQHPRALADVNGDGKQDFVGFGNAGTYVSLSTGSSFAAPALWVANYGYDAGGWRVDQHPRVLADVNGDGKQDVVGFGNAGTYVSLSTGSSFAAPALWVANYGYNAGGWRVDQHPRVLADVNGDGKQDIVGFGNDGTYISPSTGSGFATPVLWIANYGYNAGGWRVDQHPRLLADVDGDGAADIVGFGNAGAYVSR